MARSVVLNCGFSQINCGFFRPSSEKKGKLLKSHVFEVSEIQGSSVLVKAKCVRQASVNRPPYNIELELDDTRNILSAHCTCISGEILNGFFLCKTHHKN